MGYRFTKVCYYSFSLYYPKRAHSLGHGWGTAPRKYAIIIFQYATPRGLIRWVMNGAPLHESVLLQFLSDPGVPGVRSMGPVSVTQYERFLKLN